MKSIQNLHLVAISLSYEKAHTEIRGKYTFFSNYVEDFAEVIKLKNLGSCFVVSTCNRTEIYATHTKINVLLETFCEFVNGSVEEFSKYITVYQHHAAVEHLFRVSAGLESQILGDFEIVGQLKTWFKRFRDAGITSSYLEKLVNTSLEISKNIKQKTLLSNGTTSVSFAAVNYILEHTEVTQPKHIVLLGTGKIGQNTCENLVKHTENTTITVVNRTSEKAEKLAEKFDVNFANFNHLDTILQQADIILVATSAKNPLLTASNIPHKKLLIIDLSIPKNVEDAVKYIEEITLVNVDELSKKIDSTLTVRQAEIPKAEKIIKTFLSDFHDWEEKRKLAPAIISFKEDLLRLNQYNYHTLKKDFPHINGNETMLSEKLVQKLTNRFATYIQENPKKADDTLALMKDMFKL